MRVVAGRLGGRTLRAVPGAATRPTSDRVREALFSILGERVRDAAVLDLFAGTGALAIEAMSRGARSAVLVEQAPRAVAVIRANLEALGLTEVATVRRTKAEAYLRSGAGSRASPGSPGSPGPPSSRASADGPFDLVFLDPPYAMPVGTLAGLLARLAGEALAPGATVVVETSSRAEPPPWPAPLRAEGSRRYGDTTLHLAVVEPSAPDGLS
jgi:16S rRNA (guanine966-N2)-methyltransferase